MLGVMLARAAFGADAAEPFRVLGVPPTASADDVRHAFRVLVRRYHPDANPAAQTGGELSAVVTAYRRLGRLGVLAPPAAPAEPRPAQHHVDVYA
jgi:hypothetical protein